MPSSPITFGAGSSPAGVGGAGIDTPPFLPLPPLPPLPAAVNYDASTRALTENPDGTFLAVHPVDQIVEIRLTVPDGKIPAMRGVCANYAKRLQGIPAAQQTAVALDETKRVLADLISVGDVTLKAVTVQVPQPGASFVFVEYVNNRATAASGQTPTVTVPLTTG